MWLLNPGEQGQPLFAENGEPSEPVAKHLQFLKECSADQQRTQRAMDRLVEAEVLTPWSLVIPQKAGEPRQIDGLYRIDEQRLNTLDATTYATLQGAPMALIHAHLFSTGQTHQLTERIELRRQAAAPVQSEDIFGGMEDDVIRFE